MKIKPNKPINFDKVYQRAYNRGKYQQCIIIRYKSSDFIYGLTHRRDISRVGKERAINFLKAISIQDDFKEFV